MKQSQTQLACAALVATLSSAVSCGSDGKFTSTPDVAGNYTITVTNADNGCSIQNWDEGASNTGIGFLIEQDGANLKGTLQGVAGLALGLYIGTNEFKGSALENDFNLTAYGTIPYSSGRCTYTLNAKILGQTSGDAVSGTIEYAPADSANPDCASVQCGSTQNFNGTRPPSSK